MATRDRNDFPTATNMVLEALSGGEPFTLNKLTMETGLNFRTVKKVMEFLETSQSTLLEKKIDVSHMEKMTVIQMKDRVGLASLPAHIQDLIIKTAYYPTVSREEEILVYLLLHNAIGQTSAVSLQTDITVKSLLEAGHMEVEDGRYYLTSMGKMTAKGALKLYPELKMITDGIRTPIL